MAVELRQAFQRELAAGVRLAIWARIATLAVISLWVMQRAGPATWYYLTIIGALGLLGIAQGYVSRRPRTGYRTVQAVLILCDMAILAYAMVSVPPGAGEDWPLAMQLRLGNFDFFYVFLAFAVLSYSPALAMWTGLAAAIVWLVAVLAVLGSEGTFTIYPSDIERMDTPSIKAALLHEHYVSAIILIQELLLALIVAAILTLAVWRARRLAMAQVRASAERASLARYFSPAVVDELVQTRSSISEVRSLEAAVLFADIVGFTPRAEQMPPQAVVSMLRDFHQRLARAVFDHGGTVDKYIGDAIMASFGAPRAMQAPAARALQCVGSMEATIDDWNRERLAFGETGIQIAIGVHYGAVVIGDIGDERCLEFAMIGDTVNVASHLEGLCRPLEASAVVSREVLEQAWAEMPELAQELGRFEPAGAHSVKGRSEKVTVCIMPRHSA